MIDLRRSRKSAKSCCILVKKDQNSNLKLLLDEDLSPRNANVLCKEDLIDTVAHRDRGYCGALDHEVLELAYQEDRMLVTANVKDFEKFASLKYKYWLCDRYNT